MWGILVRYPSGDEHLVTNDWRIGSTDDSIVMVSSRKEAIALKKQLKRIGGRMLRFRTWRLD